MVAHFPQSFNGQMSISVLYFLRHVDAMQVRCQSNDERVMWLSFCSRSCQVVHSSRTHSRSQITVPSIDAQHVPITCTRALAVFHFKRIWAFVIRQPQHCLSHSFPSVSSNAFLSVTRCRTHIFRERPAQNVFTSTSSGACSCAGGKAT